MAPSLLPQSVSQVDRRADPGAASASYRGGLPRGTYCTTPTPTTNLLIYAQEQEFFLQATLVSKKDKEKIEIMKAVSFMYVRLPGYNAESAKAAEIADESAKEHPQTQTQTLTDATATSTSSQRPPESMPPSAEHAKKSRPKNVFGCPLPTEQEFEVLKIAPRCACCCLFTSADKEHLMPCAI
ncbi:uncharacterized zinc finger CCHC domain-containing protein At4g19190-like isoform X2 [Malus sylvestris]|uniref:uncharacterized zinc finger CCHC domain-containing protein At4g19190-like isoform X2 n=1 Tax=Malus sylvestris TaxID=3752 RepID=UPI0007EC569C|nr:uncharacterized zinc finger CCHC domain-containing protein At4g19190-like isoform X2 [Malus sylvestris]